MARETYVKLGKQSPYYARHRTITTTYLFMKWLVPDCLPYICLLKKNIKNINSFISIRPYTLMLATYKRDTWVFSLPNALNNLGPKPSSCDRFSIGHWNLDGILAYNFIKRSLLCAYISTNYFDILRLSETYFDSNI